MKNIKKGFSKRIQDRRKTNAVAIEDETNIDNTILEEFGED